MSTNFDLAVARTMAEQMGGERTRRLLLALCDEVERLRHIVADQQMMLDEHRLDNMHAYEEGVAEGERRAVAYLRAHAEAEHVTERGVPALSPAGRGLLLLLADRIERGEHRREEKTP